MNWKSFIFKLRAGNVIPVIGNDLSLVKNEKGNPVFLHRRIIKKLIEIEDLPDTFADRSIGEILVEYPHIKDTIKSVYGQISEERFYTRPLEKLAEITDFNFYVSTTFDGLLEKALRKIRDYKGSELNVIDYCPDVNSPVRGNANTETTVFNLLGGQDNFDQTAIDDERMLEYFYTITWRDKEEHPQANYFLRRVNDKSFLFIGCDFPDWLMRFVIRILTNRRIKETFSDYIVCNTGKEHGKLKNFLAYCKKDFVVIDNGQTGNAETFVDMLYEKWREEITKENRFQYEGSVFLSYYHKDRGEASTLKDALEADKIDVWYDEDDLHAGEHKDLIWEAIKKCTVFIPVISRECLDAAESYAKDYEWKKAGLAYEFRKDSDQPLVILPCFIGNVDRKDERIPAFMRASSGFDLKGMRQRVVDEIKKLLEPRL